MLLAISFGLFFSDRQTVYGEKHKKSLAEKYPANSMPDTQYNVGDQTIILRDSFVKAALVDTIYFTDYSSKKKQDKKFLENFYSAAMAGEYTLEQYTVTKTEPVPGNDSSDDYYAYVCLEINDKGEPISQGKWVRL